MVIPRVVTVFPTRWLPAPPTVPPSPRAFMGSKSFLHSPSLIINIVGVPSPGHRIVRVVLRFVYIRRGVISRILGFLGFVCGFPVIWLLGMVAGWWISTPEPNKFNDAGIMGLKYSRQSSVRFRAVLYRNGISSPEVRRKLHPQCAPYSYWTVSEGLVLFGSWIGRTEHR